MTEPTKHGSPGFLSPMDIIKGDSNRVVSVSMRLLGANSTKPVQLTFPDIATAKAQRKLLLSTALVYAVPSMALFDAVLQALSMLSRPGHTNRP